jgi:hypothetical protein
MCRNIKTLHNFEPPTTEDEIRAAPTTPARRHRSTPAPERRFRVGGDSTDARSASASQRPAA